MMLSGFLFQVMDNFFQIALNQLRPAAKNLQIWTNYLFNCLAFEITYFLETKTFSDVIPIITSD